MKKLLSVFIILALVFQLSIITFAEVNIENVDIQEEVIKKDLIVKSIVNYKKAGKCGENAYYTLDNNNKLTIYGSGKVTEFDSSIRDCRTVEILSGITELGNSIFYNCYSLTNINFSDTVVSLGGNIFDNDNSLKVVALPENLKEINDWTLYYYTHGGQNVLTYNIKDNCKYIGSKTNPYMILVECIDRTTNKINIATTTKFIYTGAFTNCFNINNIVLPDTLVYVGKSAFTNCHALKNVIYTGSEEDFDLITIQDGNSAILNANCTGDHTHCWNETLVEATVDNNGYYYEQCSICNKVRCYYTINSIGNIYADAIEFISNGKVQYPIIRICDSTGHDIPATMYDIEYKTNCRFTGTHTFVIKFNDLYTGRIECSYKINALENISVLGNKCGENVYFTFSEGTLLLEGTGEMDNYSFNCSPNEFKYNPDAYKTPWYTNRAYISEIVIGEGITNIGDFAFFDFPNLETVILSDSVETIGYYAFYNCKNLKNINWSNNLISVANFAFYGCENLDELTIPNTITFNECAFDLIGDNKDATEVNAVRMETTLEYLNNTYLCDGSDLGFELYNISNVDREVYQNIVDDITSECITEEEIVDAIGNFSDCNLTFNYSAEYFDYAGDMIRHLQGVCAGHNQFTATLLKLAGFPTAVISGLKSSWTYAYTRQYPYNHQWLMVYYDNEWHIIDTTNGYINLNINESIDCNYFICTVDGVLPITEEEDIYILEQLKPFVKVYINNTFSNKYEYNKFNFSGSGVLINNGAIWKSSNNSSSEFYEHELVESAYHSYVYNYLRNNGTEVVGSYPSIDGQYFYWNQTGGVNISEELDSCPMYKHYYYIIKNDSFPILGDLTLNNTELDYVKISNTSIAELDDDYNLIALSAGETYITFVCNGLETFWIPIKVVNSVNDIPTNAILKKYCNHNHSYEGYCTYCGAKIELIENKKPEIATPSEVEKPNKIENVKELSEEDNSSVENEIKEKSEIKDLNINNKEISAEMPVADSINEQPKASNEPSNDINIDNEENINNNLTDNEIKDTNNVIVPEDNKSKNAYVEPTVEETNRSISEIDEITNIENTIDNCTDKKVIEETNSKTIIEVEDASTKDNSNIEDTESKINSEESKNNTVEDTADDYSEKKVTGEVNSEIKSDNTTIEVEDTSNKDNINTENVEDLPVIISEDGRNNNIENSNTNSSSTSNISTKNSDSAKSISIGSRSSGSGSNKISNIIKQNINGWTNTFSGWRYLDPISNNYICSSWLCDGFNIWYLLDNNGNMISNGLVQDNLGNYYSLETTHNGYFGMLRYKNGYYDCNGQQIYLEFSNKHDETFGAIINKDGIEKLRLLYGIIKFNFNNCFYTKNAA